MCLLHHKDLSCLLILCFAQSCNPGQSGIPTDHSTLSGFHKAKKVFWSNRVYFACLKKIGVYSPGCFSIFRPTPTTVYSGKVGFQDFQLVMQDFLHVDDVEIRPLWIKQHIYCLFGGVASYWDRLLNYRNGY